MANYCTAAQAAAQTGRPETSIPQWWLDDIDALIESWTGQGYKGATRTYTHMGTGNTLIKLPARANSITRITENGDTLATTEYTLETGGRLVERTNVSYLASLYGQRAGCWYRRYKYIVEYIEPDFENDEAPAIQLSLYHMAAAECVAQIGMYIKKRKDFGIALSASDAGQAGRVSTAASTSFPAELIDDLRRKIQGLLKRGTL